MVGPGRRPYKNLTVGIKSFRKRHGFFLKRISHWWPLKSGKDSTFTKDVLQGVGFFRIKCLLTTICPMAKLKCWVTNLFFLNLQVWHAITGSAQQPVHIKKNPPVHLCPTPKPHLSLKTARHRSSKMKLQAAKYFFISISPFQPNLIFLHQRSLLEILHTLQPMKGWRLSLLLFKATCTWHFAQPHHIFHVLCSQP